MARTATKTTTKKKPLIPDNGEMVATATFTISLFQGGEKIVVKLERSKASQLVRAVLKRNLSQAPLTVVDIHGLAHTIRGLDRASYPPDLLTKGDLITAII